MKLGEQAEVLQSLIHKGRNKNKHYKAVTDEVLRHEKMKFYHTEWFLNLTTHDPITFRIVW